MKKFKEVTLLLQYKYYNISKYIQWISKRYLRDVLYTKYTTANTFFGYIVHKSGWRNWASHTIFKLSILLGIT